MSRSAPVSSTDPGSSPKCLPSEWGESPFGIASTRRRTDLVEFAVNRVGTVTDALHRLDVGDKVGIRGPLGNGFPMDQFKGKNIVVLGGGIGGAPLRPVIQTVLDNRADYGKLSIFWAARTRTSWSLRMSMMNGAPSRIQSCT